MEKQEFDKLVNLARLKFNDQDNDAFQKDFESILNYVAQLSAVNTDNVEPLAQTTNLQNIFREDQPLPSIGVDAALANAPQREGSSFKVPNII